MNDHEIAASGAWKKIKIRLTLHLLKSESSKRLAPEIRASGNASPAIRAARAVCFRISTPPKAMTRSRTKLSNALPASKKAIKNPTIQISSIQRIPSRVTEETRTYPPSRLSKQNNPPLFAALCLDPIPRMPPSKDRPSLPCPVRIPSTRSRPSTKGFGGDQDPRN